MKMSGERVIPAPQARVWEALNDPEVLRQAIPGCIEMVKHSPTEFSAKVMAKVGPVKANFAGDVTLSRLDPPNSYLISGKGTGGVAGFAVGGAEVRLEDAGGQTLLRYDVDAKVGGKLAQIGSRLIESTARRMAEDFFQRFADAVAGGEKSVAQMTAEPEPATQPARKAPARKAPARKSAAKSTPAKKPAARKTSTRGSVEPAQAAAFTAGPAVTPPDLRRPETRPEPARRAANVPGPAGAGGNIWWIVGAGIAALLVILLLANA